MIAFRAAHHSSGVTAVSPSTWKYLLTHSLKSSAVLKFLDSGRFRLPIASIPAKRSITAAPKQRFSITMSTARWMLVIGSFGSGSIILSRQHFDSKFNPVPYAKVKTELCVELGPISWSARAHYSQTYFHAAGWAFGSKVHLNCYFYAVYDFRTPWSTR